jgi:hypothetical protein
MFGYTMKKNINQNFYHFKINLMIENLQNHILKKKLLFLGKISLVKNKLEYSICLVLSYN